MKSCAIDMLEKEETNAFLNVIINSLTEKRTYVIFPSTRVQMTYQQEIVVGF